MHRRRALTAVGLAAAALVVASTAYACVPYTGLVAYAGNHNGFTDGTLSQDMDWTNHGYCSAPPGGGDWIDNGMGESQLGRVVRGTGNQTLAETRVTVSPVAPGSTCDFQVSGNNNQLADENPGTYQLRVRQGENPEGNSTTNNSCWQANGTVSNQTTLLVSNLSVISGSIATFDSGLFKANQVDLWSMCISRQNVPGGSYRSAIGWHVYTL